MFLRVFNVRERKIKNGVMWEAKVSLETAFSHTCERCDQKTSC